MITGGAGFIAHHTIGYLLKNTDWDIVTLDRLDYSGNLNRLHDLMLSFDPEVRKRVRIVHHDLKAELNPLVRSEIGQVDYICTLLLVHTLIAVLSIRWSLCWTMLSALLTS